MWSGWVLTNNSGAILGVHQKIDRVARRYLTRLIPNTRFPKIKHILFFEGKNGPDGIKAKSPGNDEPWHFYDPFDPDDSDLIDIINDHYNELVSAIKSDNYHKMAFEAAWLSHAITDGLTPAHHYPYEDELEKLRGGQPHDTRNSIKKKSIMPGKTKKEMIANNWKMWGPKGLIITHFWFEMGVALVMAPMRYHLCKPTTYDIKEIEAIGVQEYFKRKARQIAGMKMYETYYEKGWTSKLARQTRDELVPLLIKTVTLSWYMAEKEALGIIHLEN